MVCYIAPTGNEPKIWSQFTLAFGPCFVQRETGNGGKGGHKQDFLAAEYMGIIYGHVLAGLPYHSLCPGRPFV